MTDGAAMTLKLGMLVLTTFAGLISGCAASPPPKNPPAQVQLNFNFTPQGQPSFSSLESWPRMQSQSEPGH
jgi:predicted component of type VI protein secretion system